MSQTIAAHKTTTQGVVLEQSEKKMTLALPSTEYQLHLTIEQPIKPAVTGRIVGNIFAQARRIGIAQGGRGGRFIEPLYGQPRRIQGRVIAIDLKQNTLTVQSVVTIQCSLYEDQQASEFKVGDLVSFHVEPGTRFEPTT